MKIKHTLTILLLLSACSQSAQNGNSDIMDKVAARSPQATPSATVADAAPKTTSTDATGVTLANFEKLSKGMSVAEIKKIIGSEGTLVSEGDNPGYKMSMYQWKNGKNNISCMFQNDKMISKTQFGL